MSVSLLVKPELSPAAPQVHRITPESAGWRYVGFEVFDLAPGGTLERSLPEREQCVVLPSGRLTARVGGQDFGSIGLRATPVSIAAFATAGGTDEISRGSNGTGMM